MRCARLNRCSARRGDGLTALELVVSLAIVAVLTAATVPALRQALAEHRLRAAVARLHSDLAFARSQAIHRSGEVVCCPGSGGDCLDGAEWQHGWHVFQDMNGDRERQAEESLLRRTSSLDGVRILGSPHRNRLRFFPNGTAPGSNATLTFCDDRGAEAARQLSVSATGRIRDTPPGEVPGGACG